MKLTKRQQEIVNYLKSGGKIYFNAVTTYHPNTFGTFGGYSPHIHASIMEALKKKGLIDFNKINTSIDIVTLKEN